MWEIHFFISEIISLFLESLQCFTPKKRNIFGKILSSRPTTIALSSPIICIKKLPDSLTKFKKQKNYSAADFTKKSGKKYFESLNPRKASDNKSFWKNLQHW